MKAFPLRAIFLICLSVSACTGCGKEAQTAAIRIMSYNLQTLFDPVDHGGEYEDFVVSSGLWNEALYKLRIKSLASAVLSASLGRQPDVLVVQEAENKRVLSDLAEELGGYPHVLVSPHEDAILSCGILARLPVKAFNAHRIRPPEDGPSSVPRFVLEAELGDRDRSLVVMAVHLKSKLGGDAQTEEERRRAAAFIKAMAERRIAQNPHLALVIAGDFNENPDEYDRVEGAYPTALMLPEAGPGPWLLVSGNMEDMGGACKPLVFYEPWFDSDGYSYRYNGKDERIDHLLLSPAIVNDDACDWSFSQFCCEAPGFLLSADGTPLRWITKAASGYSDHLPISLLLLPRP